MRSDKLYLSDILEAINNIQKYVNSLSYAKVRKNRMLIDAVIRNLEIIG